MGISATMSDTSVRPPGQVLADQVRVLRTRLQDNMRHIEASLDKLEATRRTYAVGRSRREVLHHSAYARLAARLETLPVIEQAKGILMARSGCNADEAFEILRRASQRMNTPVRDVAAEVVEKTVTRRGSNGTAPRPPADETPGGRIATQTPTGGSADARTNT